MRYPTSLINLVRRLGFRFGITRMVLLTGSYAIKVPNPRNGWGNFVAGLMANMHEESNWWAASVTVPGDERYPTRSLLCPVVWHSWGQWVVVMKRCQRELTDQEWEELDLTPWDEMDLCGDDKRFNYGVLDGRVVKLDYGHFAFVVRWWKKEENQVSISE